MPPLRPRVLDHRLSRASSEISTLQPPGLRAGIYPGGQMRSRPKFTDGATAALIGRLTVLEELVDQLLERDDQREFRFKQIEDRLARVTSRSQLMTEKQLAQLLSVSARSLNTWRHEKPARIPFILTEGGDIRYRVEDVESYLKSRERRGRGVVVDLPSRADQR